MREFSHYTDADFQNYLDNTFIGNVSSFESHIKECEVCNSKFTAYAAVWSFAKNDLKIEPLRIDLAFSVTDKIFPEKENKQVLDKVMYGVLISIDFVCLALCLKFFLSFSISSSYILLMIPIVLFLGMSYKEIWMFKKKFELYS